MGTRLIGEKDKACSEGNYQVEECGFGAGCDLFRHGVKLRRNISYDY